MARGDSKFIDKKRESVADSFQLDISVGMMDKEMCVYAPDNRTGGAIQYRLEVFMTGQCVGSKRQSF